MQRCLIFLFESSIPKRNTTKIFIGNVKDGTTSDELRALFEEHGAVSEADVCSGYGFVVRSLLDGRFYAGHMTLKQLCIELQLTRYLAVFVSSLISNFLLYSDNHTQAITGIPLLSPHC